MRRVTTSQQTENTENEGGNGKYQTNKGQPYENSIINNKKIKSKTRPHQKNERQRETLEMSKRHRQATRLDSLT